MCIFFVFGDEKSPMAHWLNMFNISAYANSRSLEFLIYSCFFVIKCLILDE